jgi:hypothetical protein
MILNTKIGYPSLDKIHLKAINYHLSPGNDFISDIRAKDGDILGETMFCNLEGINLTIKKDKQGIDAALIYFNPNKIDIISVMDGCNKAGLDFDLQAANVIRLDIERHQQLHHDIKAYHNILVSGSTGKKDMVQFNGTYRIGTRAIQWQFYDKSHQAKYQVKNICRGETQYLKPYYLKREGINTYQDLQDADLMQLYNKPYHLYLNNLSKLGQDAALIGKDIQLAEYLYKTCSRPMQTLININVLGGKVKGLDYYLNLVSVLNIPKQKRYNAKKFLLGLSDKLNIGFQSDMVKELLKYFDAA